MYKVREERRILSPSYVETVQSYAKTQEYMLYMHTYTERHMAHRHTDVHRH